MKSADPQEKTNTPRQSNIELLRILAMCMIIAMHYMTKGMKLEKLSADGSMRNIAFWILYAFCLSSVNVYVFISGYFAPDARWSIRRILRLWGEVWLYSVGVPLVLACVGAFDLTSAGLGTLQQIFLPVTYEHYWFATAYIMLFLLAPVLNTAITKLDRRMLGAVLILLIAVFAGFKSVNPYLIPWDKYGNDVLWFVVLYLIAGYIRMYGLPFIGRDLTGRTGLLLYIAASLLTFAIAFALSFIVRNTGKLEYAMDMTYCYNYLAVLIASIGLFTAFLRVDIGYVPWINRLAGYTFGIYLLHENIVLRDRWQTLLGIEAAAGQWWQILHLLFCIVILFAAGSAVEFLRQTSRAIIHTVAKKRS